MKINGSGQKKKKRKDEVFLMIHRPSFSQEKGPAGRKTSRKSDRIAPEGLGSASRWL
jgi:hypothetical protein